MKISVIIPAYNEAKNIERYLNEVLSFGQSEELDLEVVVINDGSQDQTVQIVERYQETHPEVRLFSLDSNQGKGAAVRTGMLHAQGDIRGYSDADGASPISELKRILPYFDEGYDIVIGSRAKTSQETQVQYLWYRKVIGRVFNFLLSLIISVRDRQGQKVQDTQCGFKWFRASACQVLFSKAKIKGFAFDVEILYLANRFKFPLLELSINWNEKGDSRVNLMTDPLKMFWQVFTIRFLHWRL